MIDTKAIRSKILDLALRGKLTDQLPEDGTAEGLYQQIQEEKQALIQSGKIKKEKPLPEIAETEIPFDIPDNWAWLRWGNLSFQIQYGYNAPAKEKGDIKMVRITDIQDNKVVWNTVPFCDIEDECIDEYRLRANDILFARTGGTVGKSFLVKKVEEDAVFAGYLIRTNFSTNLNAKYMKYFMESRLYWKQLQDGTTATAQPNCNAKTLSKMIVPLPPLAEQKRIVEKIEQAFSVLDAIDELQAQYADNLTVLKSKLIDLAIRGKLTEQLPEDGTAEELYQQIQEEKQALIQSGKIKKEKPLPEINPDEIPFEIPKSWKWVRLRDLGAFNGGKTPSMAVKEYWNNGSILWVTSKDMKRKYVYSSEMMITELGAQEMAVFPENTVLFVVRSGILRRVLPVAILKMKGTINQDLKAISLFIPTMCEYAYYILKGFESKILFQYAKDGTTVNNIVFDALVEMPIPLPPLAEQKRIVDRLDKLLAVYDEMR